MAHRPQFATLLLVLRLSLTTRNSFTGGKATWRVLTRWQDHRSPTECWVLCFSAARMLSFISYNNPVREELGSSLLYRCSNWSPGSPWSELGFSRSVLTTVSDCLLWWTQCHGNHKWWLMFFKNTDFFFFLIYIQKRSQVSKRKHWGQWGLKNRCGHIWLWGDWLQVPQDLSDFSELVIQFFPPKVWRNAEVISLSHPCLPWAPTNPPKTHTHTYTHMHTRILGVHVKLLSTNLFGIGM